MRSDALRLLHEHGLSLEVLPEVEAEEIEILAAQGFLRDGRCALCDSWVCEDLPHIVDGLFAHVMEEDPKPETRVRALYSAKVREVVIWD